MDTARIVSIKSKRAQINLTRLKTLLLSTRAWFKLPRLFDLNPLLCSILSCHVSINSLRQRLYRNVHIRLDNTRDSGFEISSTTRATKPFKGIFLTRLSNNLSQLKICYFAKYARLQYLIKHILLGPYFGQTFEPHRSGHRHEIYLPLQYHWIL